MTLLYRTGDLFTSSDPALAHCVSADLRMGAGIAKAFRQKYGGVVKMREQNPQVGDAIPLATGGKTILALVTKRLYYGKPTKKSLACAVLAMAAYCQRESISKISIPRIGCGLDRMKWAFVERVLLRALKNTGVQVTVWTLEAELGRHPAS